jgi:hypothetical protein
MQAVKPFQPLSPMFNQNPASAAVGAMRPVDTSFADHGAAAAANVVEPVHVDPLSGSNFSTRDRAMAWRNPQAGGSTFMSFGDDNTPRIPDPYGSGA